MLRAIKRMREVSKAHGKREVLIRALRKMELKLDEPRHKQRVAALNGEYYPGTPIYSYPEYLKVDYVNNPYVPIKKERTTKIISWLMPQPGHGGGHQNIFRFIEYLDQAGFTNRVYVIDNPTLGDIPSAKAAVAQYCKAKNLEFYHFEEATFDPEVDIVFATTWESAYNVFTIQTDALKYYFVQDFEPTFFAIGSKYILAHNTYKFGFKGITAGKWLSTMLTRDFGMICDDYDFGADKKLYHVSNVGVRKGVFYYARPETERRGFELGIMALELFHKKHPEVVIHMAGSDVSSYAIPFPYENHGVMQLSELSDIYNQCSAGLVLSLTNMSLLPLELLSSGTIPVVNDAENNRLVSDNENIHYIEASPLSLANGLSEAYEQNKNSARSEQMAASVNASGWDDAGKKFVTMITTDLRNN